MRAVRISVLDDGSFLVTEQWDTQPEGTETARYSFPEEDPEKMLAHTAEFLNLGWGEVEDAIRILKEEQ